MSLKNTGSLKSFSKCWVLVNLNIQNAIEMIVIFYIYFILFYRNTVVNILSSLHSTSHPEKLDKIVLNNYSVTFSF